MCLVKNEADIIVETLQAARQWCDFIYVFDNGSTDGTWELILDLSEESNDQLVAYKHDPAPYRNSLLGEIFDHYRANSCEDDWWCRLDADEIYIDDPRIFLATIPDRYEVVWGAFFQYYFTNRDLALYERDPPLYSDDVPVEQKLRYYKNNWSERRFFRYRKQLTYEPGGESAWPRGLGDAYPVRIRIKHFQYRSPQQIQKRLDTRREAVSRGRAFRHEERYVEQSWRARVADASQLEYDDFDGRYVVNEALMESLRPIRHPTFTSRVKPRIRKLAIGSRLRG